MTDAALVAKKLALVETCVHELRTLAKPELLGHDVREERFVAELVRDARRGRARRFRVAPSATLAAR